MVLATVFSKNGVPIRLTDERWKHIIETHPEIVSKDFSKITEIIENPDVIFKGDVGELLAAKESSDKTWIVVPYKEVTEKDGLF